MTKELVKAHPKNDMETMKQHSVSTDIKMIWNYLLSTET